MATGRREDHGGSIRRRTPAASDFCT
jgi:hypothetical protein